MTSGEHYFSPTEADSDAETTMTVRLAGRDVEVVTASKVFSRGRVDLGTSVLLRAAPRPPATGRFLDLGCGWGPIAVSLGLLSPDATVWAVDVNDRAVQLTKTNAERLGLPNVRAVRPDEVPDDIRFDLIWSNPPIRIGKTALHELLLTWLPRLAPDGVAQLVVQRHLGADSLVTWLAAQPGLHARKASSAKGFRVIEVRRRD